jgi:ABC-type transport system involved in multi-copper enzyme maturation permease subunit
MMALLWVEVRRYLSRRLVWVMIGLSVLGMGVAGTVTFFRSHPLSPAAERALFESAEAQRRQALDECLRGAFGDIPTGETQREFCERVIGTPKYADPGFHLTSLEDAYLGTNVLLIAMFVVLAASFIGAEWHAGTITTLLTWEPRRIRVFMAKAGVACAMSFVGLVALQIILGLILLPSALFRGTTLGVDQAWFWSVLGLLVRGGAVASLAAALVVSLAFLGRNTAAAMGIAFGYFAVIEPILRAVRPGWQSYFFFDNAAALMLGNRADPGTFLRSAASAGLLLGTYAALALVATGAVFARRDVT